MEGLTLKVSFEQLNRDSFASLSEMYNTTFSDNSWLLHVALNFTLFYAIHRVSKPLYIRWVPKQTKQYLHVDKFAGVITSFFHSIVVSACALLLVFTFDSEAVDGRSPQSDFSVLLFKLTTPFSVGYFLIDICVMFLPFFSNVSADIALYSTGSLQTANPNIVRFGLLVHHTLCSFAQAGVWLSHPFVAYLSAKHFLIELTTAVMGVHYLSEWFECPRLYAVSGVLMVGSYPLVRIVWDAYLLWANATDYWQKLDACIAPNSWLVLAVIQVFIALLSTGYFCTEMLVDLPKTWTLSHKQKHL